MRLSLPPPAPSLPLNPALTAAVPDGATKMFAEGAAQSLACQTVGTANQKQVIAARFAWCPRTASDVANMEGGKLGVWVAFFQEHQQ